MISHTLKGGIDVLFMTDRLTNYESLQLILPPPKRSVSDGSINLWVNTLI